MYIYLTSCIYCHFGQNGQKGGVPGIKGISKEIPGKSGEKRVENVTSFSRVFDTFFHTTSSRKGISTRSVGPPGTDTLINSSFGPDSGIKWDVIRSQFGTR